MAILSIQDRSRAEPARLASAGARRRGEWRRPQDELGGGDGLEDVIVGAQRQPADAVRFVATAVSQQDADLARFLPRRSSANTSKPDTSGA